jgi:membrane-associated protein
VAGSLAGYGFGRSTGKFFYTRKETRFFRHSYLTSTEEFYKKYGRLAIPAGFFLPIVRTFAPVLAGIIKVKFQRFLLLSIVGSVASVLMYVLLGYLLGSMPFLKPWLKYIVTVFILAVTVPLVIKIIREMRKPPGT